MPTPRNMRIIQPILDFFLYWTVVVGLIISHTGVISPQNTYIRCNDSSFNHDFQGDTISLSVLLLVSLMVPLIMMFIIESAKFYQFREESPICSGIKKTYSLFISLLVGALFSLFVVEILKTAVSEPRPHFMISCHPNLTEELCKKSWVHVTKEDCTNPLNLSSMQIIDSMKSFPSGHAAIGAFSAVYMTIYIQNSVRITWSTLFRAWLQLLWWTWGLLCCVSRLWDNKHHWWDVAVGGSIGAVGGYATV